MKVAVLVFLGLAVAVGFAANLFSQGELKGVDQASIHSFENLPEKEKEHLFGQLKKLDSSLKTTIFTPGENISGLIQEVKPVIDVSQFDPKR